MASFVTVWAPRVFNWREDLHNEVGELDEETQRRTGWTHHLYFNALSDLMAKMRRAGLRNKVDILGIVAHGNAGGLVQLDRNLTIDTISSFDSELELLRRYLKRTAVLTFYSCIAAAGVEGTNLLLELSRRLPGRWIVGFTVFGIVSDSFPNAPGTMGYNTRRGDVTTSLGQLSPAIPETKAALNGTIVALPASERS